MEEKTGNVPSVPAFSPAFSRPPVHESVSLLIITLRGFSGMP